jgi:hypothetical protein
MAQFGDFTVDRNSTKYVLGSGGTIISYATDEPAFEFNTDGSYKGLLVEPAATNLCLRSENITTTWVPINATRTANATTALDGNTTADKLGDNGATGTGNVTVFQTITVSSSTKYTASVFLKADQLAFARLEAYQYDGANTGEQYFGLSGDGSLGTASNLDDSTITKYPDGWYRCSITFTTGANTTFPFAIYLANSISSTIVDLDGTSSIFVWGAQVETGPIATSYIPTTTASVTRVKDDITLGSASSLIGQTEGTLYVEVDWRAGQIQYLLDINDNNLNRVIIFVSGNLTMFLRVDGADIVNQGVSASGFSGIQKIAFAYKTDSFELYRNGSSISSSTSGSLAALGTLTDIDLGQGLGAAYQANMHIRAVALYPTRLSDAEAQALTTL